MMIMNMNKQKLLWAFATPSFVAIYLSLYTDQEMFFFIFLDSNQEMFFKREKGKESKNITDLHFKVFFFK